MSLGCGCVDDARSSPPTAARSALFCAAASASTTPVSPQDREAGRALETRGHNSVMHGLAQNSYPSSTDSDDVATGEQNAWLIVADLKGELDSMKNELQRSKAAVTNAKRKLAEASGPDEGQDDVGGGGIHSQRRYYHKSSLEKRQLQRHVADLIQWQQEHKIEGEVWVHTLARLIQTDGYLQSNLFNLDPLAPCWQSVRPLVREVVLREEEVFNDANRLSRWQHEHHVSDNAVEDLKRLYSKEIKPQYLATEEGRKLLETADGRREEIHRSREIPGLPGCMMPSWSSKRAVDKVKAKTAVSLELEQFGNGKGNDTASVGVAKMLEATDNEKGNALSAVWIGAVCSFMVVIAWYQDAASYYRTVKHRGQTTTANRNIKSGHSNHDLNVFSISMNKEAAEDVRRGMKSCRQYCERKKSVSLHRPQQSCPVAWISGTDEPKTADVLFAWGGDHANLTKQAGLQSGTHNNHFKYISLSLSLSLPVCPQLTTS